MTGEVPRMRNNAGWLGARFHDGSMAGGGFTVPNIRAMASGGRKLAKRPHMAGNLGPRAAADK